MKQMSQVHKPAPVPATQELERAPAQPVGVISEADLDKVSGGGGASGGVNGDRQHA